MGRQAYLEVANFICKFGDDLVMNDFYDEIIVPAFKSDSKRTIWGTTFFFHNVTTGRLNENEPQSEAVFGRLIRLTTLRREQIYDDNSNRLIVDPKSLATAPSAIFALLRKNHRLLFVREQSDSPTIKQFGSTAKRFITQTHLNYVNAQHDESRDSAKGLQIPKRHILKRVPVPEVEVLPVYSHDSLEAFVNRFKELQVVRISIAETNNEADYSNLIKQLRASKKNTNSHNTTVEHRNPQGLEKAEVVKQLKPASQGNAHIKLTGKDKNGDELVGNNENFNVRVPLGEIGRSLHATATRLYDIFKDLLKKGVVEVGQPLDQRDPGKR